MENDDLQPRKRRLTRAEARARTRELLLDAAARIFARKGFAGASVEEIAEDAGFTIGALYSNFSGKQQLFLELMARGAQDRITEAATVLEQQEHATPEEARKALGQLMVEVADKDLNMAPLQAEFWLYAIRNPETMETLSRQLQGPRETLERLIAGQLEREGSRYPRELAGRLARVMFVLFQGMVRERRLDPDGVPAELYADALRWLLTGVAASEALPADP